MQRLEIHSISNKDDILNTINSYVEARNAGFGGMPRVTPLDNAARHLEILGAKTLVKQFPVQDPDFFAEYNAFYSKTFESPRKYCYRFHFFSKEVQSTDENVLDFLDRVVTDQETYLGFITIRPIRSSPVAATILRSPWSNHFILSQDSFAVHLAGQTFYVRGTPFLQQDNAVGACAQAAIWMALRTIRQKEGDSAYDPAQISSAATKFFAGGRTLPNREGLQIPQMLEAVRFAGYSSHIVPLGKAGVHLSGEQLRDAQRLVYTYIESEIPVVLALFPRADAGHAIVMIGHGWNDSNDQDIRTKVGQLSAKAAVSWVDHFFVHNDNTGPYIRFDLDSDATYSLKHAAYAIPLLPADVFISGEEAEIAAGNLLDQVFSGMLSEDDKKSLLNKLVVRTFLCERYKFREWVTKSAMTDELKSYFRQKTMPKRIWITELNLNHDYGDAINGSGKRIGEIIMDATGDPNDAPFLSFHFNLSIFGTGTGGFVLDRDPIESSKINIMPIVNDSVYSCVSR